MLADDCFASPKGIDYGGVVDMAGGTACVRWDSVRDGSLPKPEGKDAEYKYCRNPDPDNQAKPWCYTNANGNKKLCDINECQSKVYFTLIKNVQITIYNSVKC